MSKRLTLTEVREAAARAGLAVQSWSPGDGPRYRVFDNPGADYFDGDGLFTALSLREVLAFILGYHAAEQRAIERDEAAHGPIPTFLRRQAT